MACRLCFILVNLVQNAMTSTCLCVFFINIQALAIGEYKQYLFFHTLDTLQFTSYRVQSFKAITSFMRLIHKSVCFGYPKNTKGYTASISRLLYFHAQ